MGNCLMTEYTLADLRKRAGLIQEQVADRMGVTRARVSQIERDFPNLYFQVVDSYLRALDENTTVTINGTDVALTDLRANPRDPGGQTNRTSRSWYRSAEELPLQGDQPEPGGDDPSREVDEPDAEGDQGDGGHSQQP